MIRNTFIVVLISLTLHGFCQQADSLIKVTNNLYMISGFGGNVSFLVTEHGVIVVDAGSFKNNGQLITKHVRSVTDKQIKYLIYTHFHSDHTFGACGIGDDPVIVSHANLQKNLDRYDQTYFKETTSRLTKNVETLKHQMDSLKELNSPEFSKIQARHDAVKLQLGKFQDTYIVNPDITFTRQMELFLGSDTLKLSYLDPTHTDCSIVVEFTKQKVLASGDILFNNRMPYIDSKAFGNTANWLNQVDNLSKSNYKYVIPGHGTLASIDDLKEQASYLTDLRNEVQSGITNGKSLKDILSQVKMESYSHYGSQNVLPLEIEAVYKELTE